MQDLEIEDFGSESGSSLNDSSGLDEADEDEIAHYLDTLHLPGISKRLCTLLYKTYSQDSVVILGHFCFNFSNRW